MLVRLAQENEAEKIQLIFNETKNAPYLGGFTMLEPVRSKCAGGSMIVVEDDGEILGASEVGREHLHRMKMQLIAVKEEHKRRYIGTTLYTFWSLTCALEGRFQMQDHIIGDNPVMPTLLPTLGFEQQVELRSKVRRHHALNLWTKDVVRTMPLTISRISELYNTGLRADLELKDTEKKRENLDKVVAQVKLNGRDEYADYVLQAAKAIREGFVSE